MSSWRAKRYRRIVVVAATAALTACQSPPTPRSEPQAEALTPSYNIARLLADNDGLALWTQAHTALVAVDLAAAPALQSYVADRFGAAAARRIDAALLLRRDSHTEAWLQGRFPRMPIALALRRAQFVRNRGVWTGAGLRIERPSRRSIRISGDTLDSALPWLRPLPSDSLTQPDSAQGLSGARTTAVPTAAASDAELGPVIVRLRSATLPPTQLPAQVLPRLTDARLHQRDRQINARVDLAFAGERAARTALTVLRFSSAGLISQLGVAVDGRVPVDRIEGSWSLRWGPVALTAQDVIRILEITLALEVPE